METFICDWRRRSRQPLARKVLRTFRFCVMPWKDEREPTIKYCLWRQIDVVHKFITLQNFEHNWWWSNGIRVEYFPRFTTLQLCYRVQEFMSKTSIQPEDFTGRIIFMSIFNDISWWSKENKQECESSAQLVSIYAKKDSHQEDGNSSDLDQNRSATLECKPQGEWDRIAELITFKFSETNIQSSDPQVHCLEEYSRSKVVENYQYTSAHMRERLKLFFAQLFSVNQLSIYGAVSDLCDECKSYLLEQRDLFWCDNLTHCLCPQVWWKHLHLWPMILRKKICCESTKNEWTNYHCKIVWLYWCRIPDNGWCRTIIHDKRYWRILTIYRFNGLSWVHFAKRWKIVWPERLDLREHQNWARIGSQR